MPPKKAGGKGKKDGAAKLADKENLARAETEILSLQRLLELRSHEVGRMVLRGSLHDGTLSLCACNCWQLATALWSAPASTVRAQWCLHIMHITALWCRQWQACILSSSGQAGSSTVECEGMCMKCTG